MYLAVYAHIFKMFQTHLQMVNITVLSLYPCYPPALAVLESMFEGGCRK